MELLSIHDAAQRLKADGCGALKETALRKLVKGNKVPTVKVGKTKQIIDYDALTAFIEGGGLGGRIE